MEKKRLISNEDPLSVPVSAGVKKVKTYHMPEYPARPEPTTKILRSLKSPDDKIVLMVGEAENRVHFMIHKEVLCRYSKSFQSTCKEEWKDPETQYIEFPNDEAEVIQAMVLWMYHDEVWVPKGMAHHGLKSKHTNNENVMKTAWGLFLKLYLLALEYQIPELQNDALEAFLSHWCDRFEEYPGPHNPEEHIKVALRTASFIYNNTATPDSPLRRMFIHLVMYEFTSDAISLDYLSILKNQVEPPLVFAEICYELAKYQFDNLTCNEHEQCMNHCEMGINYPDFEFNYDIRVKTSRPEKDLKEKAYMVYDESKNQRTNSSADQPRDARTEISLGEKLRSKFPIIAAKIGSII